MRFWDVISIIGLTEYHYFVICFFHYMAYIVFILGSNSFIKKGFGILFFICSKVYMTCSRTPGVLSTSWKWFFAINLVFSYYVIHLQAYQNIGTNLLDFRNWDVISLVSSSKDYNLVRSFSYNMTNILSI